MRFLLVDKILELSPGTYTKGIKEISVHEFYRTEDEQGRPCFIPSLMGEALGQLAAWNVMVTKEFTKRPVAGIVSSAELIRPVYVGETLHLESYIDALDDISVRYHSVASVDNEVVFRIENALGPLLPMETFIGETEVRAQFDSIMNPLVLPTPVMRSGHDKATVSPKFHFDEITDLKPGLSMTAMLTVDPSAPYFQDHFPKNPVLPMTVLLESKWNMARDFIKRSDFEGAWGLKEMRRIKMNDFVRPSDTLVSHLRVKRQEENRFVLHFLSEVQGARVCVLEMVWVKKDVP